MKQHRHINFLFVALLATLWLPLLFNHIPGGWVPHVAGVEPDKTLIDATWWNGKAQKNFENELTYRSKAQLLSIKLQNQFQYSFFHKINAQDVYEYNDMFFRFYSYNYNEDNAFVGYDSVQNTLNQLIELKEQLVQFDCPIITVFAPSKARYYADQLPTRNQTKGPDNAYEFYKKVLPENDIHFIDFNDYFIKNKGQFDAAIFGDGGIHWTYYAAALAMDSVISYTSDLKGVDYDRFDFELEECGGFNQDDQDLFILCNLIKKQYDNKLRNVTYSPIQKSGKKIKAVIVGDSFFYVIENSQLRKLVFTEDSDYHYYYKRTHDCEMNKFPINDDKILQQLKNADCLIFINDLVNLEHFTFGFAHQFNSLLKKQSK